MSGNRALTRDEALLALNDHCGREVEVTVEAQRGDTTAAVMSAKGLLTHWRNDQRSERWACDAREDLMGLYEVGGASFDVTDLHAARLLADDDCDPYGLDFRLADDDCDPYGLDFRLGDAAMLIIAWGVD